MRKLTKFVKNALYENFFRVDIGVDVGKFVD